MVLVDPLIVGVREQVNETKRKRLCTRSCDCGVVQRQPRSFNVPSNLIPQGIDY